MELRYYHRLETHLVNVSRSFALGIQALGEPLRGRVCLGYLICRILDTIEDYAEIPAPLRAELLGRCAEELADPTRREFLIADIRAALNGVPLTEGEAALMADMEFVFAEYDAIAPEAKARMWPTFREMARGMAAFCATENSRGENGFEVVGDLVHYCHFVAGVVGAMLTDLFILHLGDDLPPSAQGDLFARADAFGIGLQTTNILKNIGDDARRGVSFIPKPLLDRVDFHLRDLLRRPDSLGSRRFVLDFTGIVLAFLEQAIEYTEAIPASASDIRKFLVLPVVFALRTLRLGIANPAYAFHEQKLKISRDVVAAVMAEIDAAITDADATHTLLMRERDAVREELTGAIAALPPNLRDEAPVHSIAQSPTNLARMVDLFLLTFDDPREWRETIADMTIAHAPKLVAGAAKLAGKNGDVPAELDAVKAALDAAVAWLDAHQIAGNHWSGLVESNAALNAQAIVVGRATGCFTDAELSALADYIRVTQQPAGCWPTFWGGDGHFGTTVFSALALTILAGTTLATADDAERLSRAREWIRREATHTAPGFELRYFLALIGQWPWDGIPAVDPLLVLVPKDAAFSRYDFAYWIRIALVPMAVLSAKKYRLDVPNLPATFAADLGLKAHGDDARLAAQSAAWDELVARTAEKLALPRRDLERIAIAHAERWILTHQDDDGAWGGIYPGIQYSLLALLALGHSLDAHAPKLAVAALRHYHGAFADGGTIQQSCQSPVWDTAWTLFAFERAGKDLAEPPLRAAVDWLVREQILIEGDWAARTKLGFGGGWAFQYANKFYPDVDDSALVLAVLAGALGMHKHDLAEPLQAAAEGHSATAWPHRADTESALRIGVRWLLAMQNDDGGWSAFERGVNNPMMRDVPLNDLDNWLDPSTADVTGRCLLALGRLGFTAEDAVVGRALKFIEGDQTRSGAWWGRWGVNYIYGTWSVLLGLEAIGVPADHPMIARAARWLLRCQNHDGGWGETCDSYTDATCAGSGDSTASQTAWATMALCAAGMADHEAVQRGADWLIERQSAGTWHEPEFTGTGFPGHFYLRYHLYCHYFPILALGDFARRRATT